MNIYTILKVTGVAHGIWNRAQGLRIQNSANWWNRSSSRIRRLHTWNLLKRPIYAMLATKRRNLKKKGFPIALSLFKSVRNSGLSFPKQLGQTLQILYSKSCNSTSRPSLSMAFSCIKLSYSSTICLKIIAFRLFFLIAPGCVKDLVFFSCHRRTFGYGKLTSASSPLLPPCWD